MASYVGDDNRNGKCFIDVFEANTMEGMGGGDTLIGGYLADHIDGGDGDDKLSGLDGADVLIAGAGNDRVGGGAGDDAIYLSGGDASDKDTAYGSSGDDVIWAGSGRNTIDGGTGEDTVNYAFALGRVGVSLMSGKGTNLADGDTYRSIENIVGNDYGNWLSGNGGVNHISGGRGNDIIQGWGGGDYLDGGDGVDLLNYRGAGSGVRIELKLGFSTRGDARGDHFVNFENLNGSNFDDQLYGDDGPNELDGLGGLRLSRRRWWRRLSVRLLRR